MADTVLPKDQATELLTKLSSDDAFRTRYAKNPADALGDIVPASVLAQIPPSSLQPITLADKASFAAALQQVGSDEAAVLLCLKPPTISLSFGS